MKINGKKITGVNEDYVVIPRASGNIVFKIRAIVDKSEFDRLVPAAKPGTKMMPGGAIVEDREDASFRQQIVRNGDLKYAWTCLVSLSATEGLEWETVRMSDPSTWLGWEKELADSDFTSHEIEWIQYKVMEVNSLSQSKLEEARSAFLASLVVTQTTLSSQTGEQPSTPSGVDVNALV